MFTARSLSRSIRSRATSVAAAQQPQRCGLAHMPIPQSSKAVLFEGQPKDHGWKRLIAFYFTGSSLLAAAILGYAPVTDAEAWAQEEARARLSLQEKGFTNFEFGTHYQNVEESLVLQTLAKVSSTSLDMGEDEDDEEEEDEDDE